MSRGFPSMTALLGLIAVAGFQNREKIMEMLSGGKQPEPGPTSPNSDQNEAAPSSGLGGLLASLGGAGAAAGAGGALAGGLGELLDRFKQTGHNEAESWVSQGPNKDIAPNDLEHAIGPEILDVLAEQTGLSREELVSRLSRDLPRAVNDYTPTGRL